MRAWLSMFVLETCFAALGCRSSVGSPAPASGVAPLEVTSTAFTANGAIPADYSCDGRDVAPPLHVEGLPSEARTWALVIEDPDAPGGTFTHDLVWNLPASTRDLGEGADPTALGASVGKNDFGKLGYGGPCPPKGQTHHYHFRVFATDATLTLAAGEGPSALGSALKGHVLGEGRLVAMFGH